MDSKQYIYLGSLNKNRSYGRFTDKFLVRFKKAGPKKKVELITEALEVAEIVSTLRLASLLRGLWLVNAELFEKDEDHAAEEVKLQLITALSKGLSLPAMSSPIYVAPNSQQGVAADGLVPTTEYPLDVQSSKAERVASPVCEPLVEPLNVPPVTEYADIPHVVNPTIEEQPAPLDAQSILKGFFQIR